MCLLNIEKLNKKSLDVETFGGVKLKVETVEQFKILEFIKANFDMSCIDLELIDRFVIEVKDQTGDKMQFKYENGKIVY